ncbi:hypothetical protein MalM25_32950 [Planctomycetes bacterium MalM25]|nr:hypothetical protein MalM25_32950 [Planctomycetes bacterium MalM25]
MTTPPPHTGVVCPDNLYTLTEFKSRVGLSEGALRKARRAGLRVRYAHRRGYVLGGDWIDYVRSLDPDQDENASGGSQGG